MLLLTLVPQFCLMPHHIGISSLTYESRQIPRPVSVATSRANPSGQFGGMDGWDRANIDSFINKPLNFLEIILQSKKELGHTAAPRA